MRIFLMSVLLILSTAWAGAAEIGELPEELQKLVKQLSDEDDKKRKSAAKALGKMKEAASTAAPWVAKRLETEENIWVKKELRKALRRISKDEEEEKTGSGPVPPKDADGNRIPLPNPEKMTGRVIYTPDGIGKMGGADTKCTVAVKEIPGIKQNNKYLSMHFTGKEWSGKILNWCDFWEESPFIVNPEQHTHIVLRCLYMGRPGDTQLTVALQLKKTGDQDGVQTKFLRLSNYDPKHQLQKSRTFVDIPIPLEDFQNTVDEAKRKNMIWGISFGNMSDGSEKDMGLLLKGISFAKAK